jgi:hypothetical protein
VNKWWKNPVLQGPDNDYGEYDYLIEELPHDYVKWEYDRYVSKCDSCGKERHLLLKSAHYFYTLDGYDYMNYDECWVCRLKSKVWNIKHKITKKIKKEIQIAKDAFMLAHTSSAGNFRYYYKLVKEIRR